MTGRQVRTTEWTLASTKSLRVRRASARIRTFALEGALSSRGTVWAALEDASYPAPLAGWEDIYGFSLRVQGVVATPGINVGVPMVKIGRNASTGKFVKVSTAKAKPSTHVVETIRRPATSPKKGK